MNNYRETKSHMARNRYLEEVVERELGKKLIGLTLGEALDMIELALKHFEERMNADKNTKK